MKIWSREFTRFEKILLVVLGVLVVGLVYINLVDRPVRASIAASREECSAIETELAVVRGKADRLDKLDAEMSEIRGRAGVSRMESYNNSKEEIAALNQILSATQQYTITFSDVTRNNDQIRREFTLNFRTADYREMRYVIEELCNCKYRCLVDEVRCTATNTEKESYVSASLTATFFETMVGGTPDAGLPEDEAESQEDIEASVEGLR